MMSETTASSSPSTIHFDILELKSHPTLNLRSPLTLTLELELLQRLHDDEEHHLLQQKDRSEDSQATLILENFKCKCLYYIPGLLRCRCGGITDIHGE
jgi:hypothetical protein